MSTISVKLNLVYTLEMEETGTDGRGCTTFDIAIVKADAPVISMSGFAGSPLHADDSCQTIASALTFLLLKPGDTDQEYFADHTMPQLEWLLSDDADALRELVEYLDKGVPLPSMLIDGLEYARSLSKRDCNGEYLDIRLRVFKGQWYLLTGDSQYDQDHRGNWAASSLDEDTTDVELHEIAENLVSHVIESFWDDHN